MPGAWSAWGAPSARTPRSASGNRCPGPRSACPAARPGCGRSSGWWPRSSNVASVGFAEGDEALSEWRARPNFRTLGPRLGSRAQAAAEAIRADDGTLGRDLAAGRSVVVPVEGGAVTIGPEDVELVQQTRPGWGMATDGAFTVALDLEVDDDLRAEGAVREVVHHVQALRRSAGLDLTDRIVLGIDAPEGGLVARALDEARDRVAAEVLAVDLRPGPVDDPSGIGRGRGRGGARGVQPAARLTAARVSGARRA